MLATAAALQLGVVALCKRVDESRARNKLPVHVEPRAEQAHDFAVEGPSGERFLVRARSGGYQLVHFWATWCPPCRKELPTLIDMARRDRRQLRVWAVSTDSAWAAVSQFLDDSVPKTVVRDVGGRAARTFGVTGLPDSYLIDPHGRIVARFSGAQNWSSGEMQTMIDQIIRDSTRAPAG